MPENCAPPPVSYSKYAQSPEDNALLEERLRIAAQRVTGFSERKFQEATTLGCYSKNYVCPGKPGNTCFTVTETPRERAGAPNLNSIPPTDPIQLAAVREDIPIPATDYGVLPEDLLLPPANVEAVFQAEAALENVDPALEELQANERGAQLQQAGAPAPAPIPGGESACLLDSSDFGARLVVPCTINNVKDIAAALGDAPGRNITKRGVEAFVKDDRLFYIGVTAATFLLLVLLFSLFASLFTGGSGRKVLVTQIR